MCFSLVDSRLLQATRLSNPLVQKMKSKLFMELLCSINTQVENKRGGNKKDMAHSMLIHLSIFGGPQVAYKEFFVSECVSHAYRAASGAQSSWEISLHSPSHPITG